MEAYGESLALCPSCGTSFTDFRRVFHLKLQKAKFSGIRGVLAKLADQGMVLEEEYLQTGAAYERLERKQEAVTIYRDLVKFDSKAGSARDRLRRLKENR